MLRQWMGCHRLVYNRALAASNATNDNSERFNEKYLKHSFAVSSNIEEEWLKSVPCSVRSEAVRDLCKAFWSNMAKRKKTPSHKFHMRFKSKKNPSQIFKAESRFVHVEGDFMTVYPRIAVKELRRRGTSDPGAKIKMRFDRRSLDFKITHDCVFTMDKRNRFFVHVPTHDAREERALENQERSICACDPGVRTFQTTYSPDGDAFKLGDDAGTRIKRLLRHVDDLNARVSALAKSKNGLKREQRQRIKWKVLRMKGAQLDLWSRIKNLVSELHWKAARFLCERYHTVIIPPFETRRMSTKENRKLTNETTRIMGQLSHFTFRARLQHKAKQFGTNVEVRGEEYTTKTCTFCGELNDNVGGSKVFACPKCGFEGCRDAAAARNIFIKNTILASLGH